MSLNIIGVDEHIGWARYVEHGEWAACYPKGYPNPMFNFQTIFVHEQQLYTTSDDVVLIYERDDCARMIWLHLSVFYFDVHVMWWEEGHPTTRNSSNLPMERQLPDGD